jgi:hypothetical protein
MTALIGKVECVHEREWAPCPSGAREAGAPPPLCGHARAERQTEPARPVWVAFQPFCRPLRAAHARTDSCPTIPSHKSIAATAADPAAVQSATLVPNAFFFSKQNFKLFGTEIYSERGESSSAPDWLRWVTNKFNQLSRLHNLKSFNWFWFGGLSGADFPSFLTSVPLFPTSIAI